MSFYLHPTYQGALVQSSVSLTALPMFPHLGGSLQGHAQRLKLEKPEINQPLDLTAELF